MAYLNLDPAAFYAMPALRQALGNITVVIGGNYQFDIEGSGTAKRKAIRTTVIDEPVCMWFSPAVKPEGVLPLVKEISFYARANIGQEKHVPRVTYCGINTFDYTAYSQTEYPTILEPDGSYKRVWATNSPLNEFLVLYVELRNMKFWNFSIIEQVVA